jgi:hypothetical protein
MIVVDWLSKSHIISQRRDRSEEECKKALRSIYIMKHFLSIVYIQSEVTKLRLDHSFRNHIRMIIW